MKNLTGEKLEEDVTDDNHDIVFYKCKNKLWIQCCCKYFRNK